MLVTGRHAEVRERLDSVRFNGDSPTLEPFGGRLALEAVSAVELVGMHEPRRWTERSVLVNFEYKLVTLWGAELRWWRVVPAGGAAGGSRCTYYSTKGL